jgi:hypothetical protein
LDEKKEIIYGLKKNIFVNKISPMKNKLDFPFFTIEEIDDGIVHIHIKEMEELRVEDVAQIYDVIEKIGGGKKVGILSTFDGLISSYKKGVPRYASSARAQELVLATAYVTDSLAMRMMVRFFLNFHKHKIPRRIFPNREQAMDWLRQMRKNEKVVK